MDRALRAQLLAILTIVCGALRASPMHHLCSQISRFRYFRWDGTLFAIEAMPLKPTRELVRCSA
jgi:hypothetical protein